MKHFAFGVTSLFFYELLIGPQPAFLECIVLLFSCNPIGQLCLSGPGYSSRTAKVKHSYLYAYGIFSNDQNSLHIKVNSCEQLTPFTHPNHQAVLKDCALEGEGRVS